MSDDGIECGRHGKQGFGIVCIHVGKAIDSGEQVGFFWSPDQEMARPFAWCSACEEFLNKNGGDVGMLASWIEQTTLDKLAAELPALPLAQ